MQMPQKAAFVFVKNESILSIHHVHCNFKAKAHICCWWCSPHSSSPC